MGLARTRDWSASQSIGRDNVLHWQPWFLFTEATPAASQPSKPYHLNGMKILLGCNVAQTTTILEYLKF